MFQRLAVRRMSDLAARLAISGSTMRPVLAATGLVCGAILATLLAVAPAGATPSLIIDQDSGAVLYAEDATEPWYPASLTKLMTAYVLLDEMRAGRVSADSLLVVSSYAANQSPSKMGFRPGTVVTVDNALKMLLVKSANDIAVTIAEGIGGSVPGFADKMNSAAQRLGMADSHFENPNGLPNAAHHSSAQDLAILARALLTEFPNYRDYFGIGAIALGDHVFHTFNGLLGRYPGVDGMKTGFICAGGFNTVVSATRGGRKLIAVVLGQPSASIRTAVTANLLDKGFAGGSGWGAFSTVTTLARVGGPPPDMHAEICGRRARRHAVTWEQEAVDTGSAPCNAGAGNANPVLETLLAQHPACGTAPAARAASPTAPVAFEPITVFVGPAPGSATAVQLPATLATLAASQAASAKRGAKQGVPGTAAAFASPGGSEADALPGSLKAGGTPVRLHGVPDDKTVSGKAAQARAGKHGGKGAAKVAAKTPAADTGPAAPAPKGKAAAGTGGGKGKGKGGKGSATAQAGPVQPAAPAGKAKGKKAAPAKQQGD